MSEDKTTTSREEMMVVLRCDNKGTPTVWCDPEIADLVDSLNNDNLSTVASCSGHGVKPGIIALKDGRELLILPDYDSARLAERIVINAFAQSTPHTGGVSDLYQKLAGETLRADQGWERYEAANRMCLHQQKEIEKLNALLAQPAAVEPKECCALHGLNHVCANAAPSLAVAEPAASDVRDAPVPFAYPGVIDCTFPNQEYVALGFESKESRDKFIKATRHGGYVVQSTPAVQADKSEPDVAAEREGKS